MATDTHVPRMELGDRSTNIRMEKVQNLSSGMS